MISVRSLSMRLTSGGRAVDVLTDVSLEVPAGQFVAIAGPSGSGKSTLLGLIAGLDQPTGGRIEVAGVTVADKNHLHHQLLEIGHSHRKAVLVLWTWSALLASAEFFSRSNPAARLRWTSFLT